MFSLIILSMFGCDDYIAEDISSSDSGVIEIADCENDFNERACNLKLRDQNDKRWRLYDHEDGETAFILDFSFMWCLPCQQSAIFAEELSDKYPDVQVVTIMMEDFDGYEPSLADVQSWAEEFSVSGPVLQGGYQIFGIEDDQWEFYAYPTFFGLDKDLVVTSRVYGYSEYYLEMMVSDLSSM